ncbi:MAG TPA: glycerophosphodiester phosphodiesterase family protein [Kofleriaceae bacterium]|nr:glycerophosphodiester phosphodiesterase family protein [Kofleriaceae bacterium]
MTRSPATGLDHAIDNPFLAGKHKPIVVGHRGVPHLHQENTLAGFRRAVALGLPAVELDVRITKDGRAVCVHDSNLRRLTGTAVHVTDLTWDEISKLRIRRELPMGHDAHGKPVIQRYDREETIPLLAEVLAETAAALVLNVELKIELPRWWRIEAPAIVAAEITRAKVANRVIVTSFDPRTLLATRRASREIAVGFCFDDTMLDFAGALLDRLPPLPIHLEQHHHKRRGHNARRLLNRLLESDIAGRLFGTRLVGADHTLVGRGTVEALHRQGVAIGTHTLFPLGSATGKPIASTAATVDEVDRLVRLGVDWIESDDPEQLQQLIG